MFGMNVDVLADSPSIKWYFIIAVPLTVLTLTLALVVHERHQIRQKMSRFRKRRKPTQEE
jgi:Mg2+ and Co2+ transporter CorA